MALLRGGILFKEDFVKQENVTILDSKNMSFFRFENSFWKQIFELNIRETDFNSKFVLKRIFESKIRSGTNFDSNSVLNKIFEPNILVTVSIWYKKTNLGSKIRSETNFRIEGKNEFSNRILVFFLRIEKPFQVSNRNLFYFRSLNISKLLEK